MSRGFTHLLSVSPSWKVIWLTQSCDFSLFFLAAVDLQGSIHTLFPISLVATPKVCWTAGWHCGQGRLKLAMFRNWLDSHSALLLFRKTTTKTQISKHCRSAVREVVGMVLWKVYRKAIHLLIVSQDTSVFTSWHQTFTFYQALNLVFCSWLPVATDHFQASCPPCLTLLCWHHPDFLSLPSQDTLFLWPLTSFPWNFGSTFP